MPVGHINIENRTFIICQGFQEGQLSFTGESMCTKYWLTA